MSGLFADGRPPSATRKFVRSAVLSRHQHAPSRIVAQTSTAASLPSRCGSMVAWDEGRGVAEVGSCDGQRSFRSHVSISLAAPTVGQVEKHAFRGSIPFTVWAASPVHSSSLPSGRFNERRNEVQMGADLTKRQGATYRPILDLARRMLKWQRCSVGTSMFFMVTAAGKRARIDEERCSSEPTDRRRQGLGAMMPSRHWTAIPDHGAEE